MKNLPPLDDHRFWHMLQDQCRTPKPMSRIAAELGVDIDDLCEWMMAYTSKPKSQKTYVNRLSEPAENNYYPLSKDAQRFAAWRRAKAGAMEALRALEADQS